MVFLETENDVTTKLFGHINQCTYSYLIIICITIKKIVPQIHYLVSIIYKKSSKFSFDEKQNSHPMFFFKKNVWRCVMKYINTHSHKLHSMVLELHFNHDYLFDR